MLAMRLFAIIALALSYIANAAPLSNSATTTDPDCPPGIIATPSYGTTDGVFSVCNSIIINAPQQNIYHIIQNFSNYPAWNTFVVSVTKTSAGPYALNSTMTFHNAMIFPLITYPSNEQISIWNQESVSAQGEKELNVAWVYDTTTPELLRAEHLTTVRDLGNGSCKVVSLETYYGSVATLVQLLTGVQLRRDFLVQNEDLKAWAEAGNTH